MSRLNETRRRMAESGDREERMELAKQEDWISRIGSVRFAGRGPALKGD
jgi:hypothetical protein